MQKHGLYSIPEFNKSSGISIRLVRGHYRPKMGEYFRIDNESWLFVLVEGYLFGHYGQIVLGQ